MRRILITGCGGMLGSAMREVFPDAVCTDIDCNRDWIRFLDVRDFGKCKGYIKNVDVVINLAALTDMEECEEYPLRCFDTNHIGAKNIADSCAMYGKELVYVSTAGIFSEKGKEYFSDSDIPKPLSHYAISKYLGELATKNVLRSYVVRAGWMFGGGRKDKKFIMKIFKQIKSGRKELFIVNDKKGTPTYTVDFARGIKNLLDNNKYGVYNQVCEGYTDRLEVAKELVSLLDVDVKINEVTSDYFLEYYAARPDNESLKNSDGVIMRHWKECLAEYCDNILKGML